MNNALKQLYKKLVLGYPAITLIVTLSIIAALAVFVPQFRLDASADSLVLENDKDLRYYRSIRARYGSDDYLVITYTPKNDLFDNETLNDIQHLKSELLKIERVDSVMSILDVPLINSPSIDLDEIQKRTPRLRDKTTDINLARKEFRESPLYSNLLVSRNGKTTALQVLFKHDETYQHLLSERNTLREKQLTTALSPEETLKLEKVSREFRIYSTGLMDQNQVDIARIRDILTQYSNRAEVHLGGLPMIVADMIDYIAPT